MYAILFYDSLTKTFVLPCPDCVMSPGSVGTTGSVQRKTHSASSGLQLTQPCDWGVPKLLCQNVEWIAIPLLANNVVQPMPARSYPPPVVPPVIWTAISLRQIVCLPSGVAHSPPDFVLLFSFGPVDTRQ